MAFIITWLVGFIWCFFLKVPATIYSLFLRSESNIIFQRAFLMILLSNHNTIAQILLSFFSGCLPESASYIAVTIPVKVVDDNMYKNKFAIFLFMSISRIRSALAFVFSDESLRSFQGWQYKVTFCKVKTDTKTGTRYFYFRFRRYIYNDDLNRFIPGFFDVSRDTAYGSWLDKSYLHRGLSQEEAVKRLGIVGPNVLDLKKPTLFSAISAEFSKTFYLYQTFMIWIWGKEVHSVKPFQVSLLP